ncbi:hypothetical protein C8P66_105132 [Humitalea rosea]|uniref:Fe-S protein YdhL (DUF1289 family) n=1 Tax=Humitalea rosea TaxID=990373 RepID=A0A2W7IN45_9PROT|nr:DUF1289 domain-containing protein [Humitalea rosea]PZW48383.1 hypothetical protein C8P66_105132 [Humitalea rosea]
MESPCKQICVLDAAGRVCLGCGRTLAEIAAWGTATEAEQARIAQAAAARLAR